MRRAVIGILAAFTFTALGGAAQVRRVPAFGGFPPVANYLAEPGFESGGASWTKTGTPYEDSGFARAGSWSMFLQGSRGFVFGEWVNVEEYASQAVTVPVGAQVTASCWIKLYSVVTLSRVRLYVDATSGDGSAYTEVATLSQETEQTEQPYTQLVGTPVTATNATVYFMVKGIAATSGSHTGYWFVDDCVLSTP